MEILAFDTETHLFGPCNLFPQIVCCSMAYNDGLEVESGLEAVAEPEKLQQMIDMLFNGSTEGFIKVAQNAAFDMGVAFRYRPELISGIFKEIEEGRVHCTIIREKLLNLTTHGDLKFVRHGGFKKKIEYSLAALVMQYLNIDIKPDKEESDAWRTNYSALEHMPVSEWPEDARDYAIKDSEYLLPIWHAQEERRTLLMNDRGLDPFKTLSFRVGVDFCLKLMSAWGIRVDPNRKAEVELEYAAEVTPDKMNLLIDQGILVPEVPPTPYKRDVKDKDGNPKMKVGKKEKIDTKKLKAYVEAFAAKTEGVVLRKTKASDRYPDGTTSTDAEFMDEYWHLDPVLEQFRHRASMQKMITVELPRMNWEGETSPIVHPIYDVLKETGRTSSFAGDKYPSFNCQNVLPKARSCYIPRDGTVFLSSDYNQMELGTTAQKSYELFGQSMMRDKINAGVDLHEYLGAQLAFHLEETFSASCQSAGAMHAEQIFNAFTACKNHPEESVRKFFKHYRTFAKPTGLGYPGGLGPKTFIQYAKATYGIIVDEAMAKALREVWRQTFPEMVSYHKWVSSSCQDPSNVDKDGKPLYAYSTPMGMYRAGCTYCAVANGAALQSPSAEGALIGLFNIVRAVYDPAMNSPLYGVYRPIMFIHDEIFGELPDDTPQQMGIWIDEIERLMIESMRVITPDVTPRVESVLMRRWDKFAEPTHNAAGQLVVTEEKGAEDESKAETEVVAAPVAG